MHTGNADCPVQLYKEYARHRPINYCEPDTRFYLTPIKEPKNDIWYTRQPLGKNTIGNIAKAMALDGNIPSTKITNHSGRKTAIQTLLHAGIPPTDVMQLTGHKNVQSLNSYAHLSTDQQQSMSNLLSTQLSAPERKPIKTAHAAAGLSSKTSNFNSLHSHNDSIINQQEEPFADEEQVTLSSQSTITEKSITTSQTFRNLIPSQSGAHDFLNGATINGNISFNFYSTGHKRCRVENSLSVEHSQENED